MTMFWSHILWHITTACWCYFWDLDIVWGATAKESKRSTFWVEFNDTLRRYRGMYISLTLLLGETGRERKVYQHPLATVSS